MFYCCFVFFCFDSTVRDCAKQHIQPTYHHHPPLGLFPSRSDSILFSRINLLHSGDLATVLLVFYAFLLTYTGSEKLITYQVRIYEWEELFYVLVY